MRQQAKKQRRLGVWSRMGAWGTGLFCVAVMLWQCVAPPNIDPTYKLCQASSDCPQGSDCVLNACVARSIRPLERGNKEPSAPDAEKVADAEQVIPEPDGSTKEADPPEKRTCPADLPNCQFCTRKEDCGVGFVCKVGEDVCRPGCVNNLDCKEPSKPNCDIAAAVCKECVTTRDCKLDKPGTLCLNDVCSGCTANEPCKAEYGSDSVCAGGKCETTKCSTNADCSGKCSGEGDCLCLNAICGFCGSNVDCGAGKQCVAKKCVSGCTKDADCGSPLLVCQSNECVKSVVLQGTASQWSDGTVGTDCVDYRFPSKVGYAAATKDGLYSIKPTASTSAFPVYCDMTYAGGGWTLVLKADGTKTDFAYTSALWTDTQPFADGGVTPSPDINRTQAKLESYWTVPVGEILLRMQEGSGDKVRSGIVHIEGSSMRDVMNKPAGTKFGGEMGQTVWRSLVKESSLDKQCFGEGVNLRTSNSDVNGVRLGFWATGSNCKPSSAVGFGLDRALSPTVGNFAGASADAGSKTTAAFGYVLVRKLPVRGALIDDVGAKAPAPNEALPSCLAYHLPPYSAVGDGAYWIKPASQAVRKKAYCVMGRLGGGWTQAMKVDGRQTTFLYDTTLWEDKTYLNEDKITENVEAKFESFGTLGFSQIALAFRSPATALATDDRFVVLHKSATSLHALFSTKAYSGFDYDLGRATWKSVIPGGGLGKDCSREGFNMTSTNAMMRLGVIAFSGANCTSNGWNTRLGVGGKGGAVCSMNPNSSAGNDAAAGCLADGTINMQSFVFVLVR